MKYYESRSELLISEPMIKEIQNKISRKKAIKKRRRKSCDQLKLLAQEFKVNKDWDKTKIAFLSRKTGLSEGQIYKWSWDQKRKAQFHSKLANRTAFLADIFNKLPDVQLNCKNKHNSTPVPESLDCKEKILPRFIDLELYRIQKNYKSSVEYLGSGERTPEKFFEHLEGFCSERGFRPLIFTL